jgi:hypothetical protein
MINIVSDFLNPVPKEKVVEESGLLGQVDDIGTSNLATDLNPPALGLTADGADIITLDSLFPDETDFQYYELITLPLELQV